MNREGIEDGEKKRKEKKTIKKENFTFTLLLLRFCLIF